jgi:hypothetical protein
MARNVRFVTSQISPDPVPSRASPLCHVVKSWGGAVHKTKLAVGAVALAIANGVLAGPVVPLGEPLGSSLGSALAALVTLGLPLGSGLPIAGIGLVSVAAVSLVVGVRIARRKHKR